MAIDLNGTLAGVNNTIAYTEGGASISIAPAARVGAGSTSINSDQWVQIKVTMLNPQAGDLWSIKSLPLGMSVSSTSGGAPLPLPVDVSIVTSPVLCQSCMGGDDTYRINTAGMSITAGDGRALIELGIDALNTELNLGDGHRAQLHVKAPTAIASADEPPATVLARIDGGAHNTWIDASDANVELHVVAMDGWGTIQMGGLTRVTVGQDMDRLDIQCGQHAQWKELYIEMGDPGFDFDQLITADGQQGKFLKTVVDGQEVYETRWYHASGGYTELRYTGHESDNVEIAALNGTFVRPLDDLVASPLAHS